MAGHIVYPSAAEQREFDLENIASANADERLGFQREDDPSVAYTTTLENGDTIVLRRPLYEQYRFYDGKSISVYGILQDATCGISRMITIDINPQSLDVDSVRIQARRSNELPDHVLNAAKEFARDFLAKNAGRFEVFQKYRNGLLAVLAS